MILSEMQTLIGSLTNDPNHDRYTLADINTELDNTLTDVNIEVGVVTDTVTIITVSGQRQYVISDLTGTVIGFKRVTFKGLTLAKRSVAYFDLYAGGTDWTTVQGIPLEYAIEDTDPAIQVINIHPTPGEAAALVIQYILQHTPMTADTDVPFMSGAASNAILRPYDWYWCYATAARLLMRDPSPENVAKVQGYSTTGATGKANLIQVFKALEKEVPFRLRPDRIGTGRW